ncbi:MAG TPA: OadG family transporter subunit [Rhodocyclaceae bacterium]
MLDSLAFILSGFAVVMGALALLWAVSALIGRAFTIAATANTTPRPPTPAAAPGVPAAHVAAISAAVAVITGGRGRVVAVRAPADVANAWALGGRANQLASRRERGNWAHLPATRTRSDSSSPQSKPPPDSGRRKP